MCLSCLVQLHGRTKTPRHHWSWIQPPALTLVLQGPLRPIFSRAAKAQQSLFKLERSYALFQVIFDEQSSLESMGSAGKSFCPFGSCQVLSLSLIHTQYECLFIKGPFCDQNSTKTNRNTSILSKASPSLLFILQLVLTALSSRPLDNDS